MNVTLTVNGETLSLDVPPSTTLLDLLRDRLGLHGTKEYCHSGVCGACTVLANGRAVSSCSMLAGQVDGADVLTIEGLTPDEGLHPIQQAFVDNFGLQCGYCTPGMILLAKALLDENPSPTREEIIRYMGGNICRCTGYAGILRSVEAAVKERRSWS
ncbi:MAG: (2Fe-2S)-binding protein [Chloroflexota bacterium]|nr:(2Fe-2S)-binding protein [Chloroflexota bacterium]MDE2885561.1 (2Fe-2S)-binding protein [Chloroflexota bacterium]